MRLGLIARADSRGLGIQTKAFHDHMRPAKTMVVDCPSAKPLPIRRDWYSGATWIKGLPTAQDFRRWLDGIDVVYTAETGYSKALWSEAERAGVRTVLHANYEFLDRADRPSLWAAPSSWHFDDFPAPKCRLPVPIESDKFVGMKTPIRDRAEHFLHIVGRPAAHDRNGTGDLLQAIHYVRNPIQVTMKCQELGYMSGLMAKHNIKTPPNVTFIVDNGDTPNYWDNYADQDVLIMPRKFGGLCLPAQEALAAGLPVIMTDISPNEWLPADWLVPARHTGAFMAKHHIDLHMTDPRVLAEKIDQFATDAAFFVQSQKQASAQVESLSWEALKPEYERVFAAL